ncbi:MAG: hypothetical protein J6B29_03155 [Clostridia bacterium]|nr:hypothetical protein [Clostridia bacterium]
MKKKIILMLSVAILLVCVFAISISAETVISENNLDENGDIVADVLTDLGDNHHILSVDISYNDANGQVKNGKFYYETSYWSARNMRQVKTVYVPADFDFSQMIYIFDKADYNGNGDYSTYELTKLNEGGGGFKMYSYTSYDNGTFTDTANIITSIERISYSKYFVKLADGGFGSKAPKLTTITYNGREPIEGALIVSSLIDEIFTGSFGGDGGSITSNSLVTPFTKLIFEDREISVSFGQYCFTRNIIEEIYFGKGTYNLSNRERIALLFESDYKNGEGATLKTVILHKDAKISSGEISWNVGSYDVIVLGSESECKEYYEANHQSKLPCAKSVTYNPCYLGHTCEDDYNCETALVCAVCDETLVEAKAHTINESLKYVNGYASAGAYTVTCTNDGCEHSVTEEAPALFVCLGYSASESGNAGLILAFKVNHEAIENYKTETGNALEYGMFAVLKSNIGENGILNADGSENAGVIKADLTKNQFAVVSMKVKGFTTDEQKDAQIALGLYVIVDGEEKEISYYQSGTPAEGEQFTSTSYNQQVSTAQ